MWYSHAAAARRTQYSQQAILLATQGSAECDAAPHVLQLGGTVDISVHCSRVLCGGRRACRAPRRRASLRCAARARPPRRPDGFSTRKCRAMCTVIGSGRAYDPGMAHASHAMNMLFTQRSLAVAKAHVQCVATGREKMRIAHTQATPFTQTETARVDSVSTDVNSDTE